MNDGKLNKEEKKAEKAKKEKRSWQKKWKRIRLKINGNNSQYIEGCKAVYRCGNCYAFSRGPFPHSFFTS
jgi:hypothetical protein